MKNLFLVTLLVLMSNAAVTTAQDFWHQAEGTEGGEIKYLATRGDGMSFASDGKKLFKRSVKDAQWTERTVPKDRIITSILIDKYGALIAGTNSGVFRSATGGDSWGLMGLDSFKINKLFSDSREGLFAVYEKAYNSLQFTHYESDVKTWIDFKEELFFHDAFCVDSSGFWYVVAADTGLGGATLKRSSDKGNTWEFNAKIYFGRYYLEAYTKHSFSLISLKTGKIWVGTSGWYWGDPGTPWSSPNIQFMPGGAICFAEGRPVAGNWGGPYSEISPLCFAQDSTGKVYAGTKDGLYFYQDSTWKSLGLKNYEIVSISIDQFGNIIAAVSDYFVPRYIPQYPTKQYRLYILKAGKTEWEEYYQNIHAASVADIAADNSGKIAAAMNNGIFLSENNGKLWTKVYNDDASAITFSDSGKIYAANESGSIFLVDKDTTIFQQGIGTNIRSLTTFNSELYVITQGKYLWPTRYEPGEVFKTWKMSGSPWQKIPNSLFAQSFFKTDNELFFSKRPEYYKDSIKPQLLQITSDDRVDSIFAGNVCSLAKANAKLYIATDSGIYRRDGETIFTKLNFPFKTTALVTANDDVMYAASGSKIYRSSDEWQTWEDVSKGMRGDVTQLAVTNDGYLVAGTSANGLFVSYGRTHSVLKIANVAKECVKHIITIQGDSLHNFTTTAANVRIEALQTLPSSSISVVISLEDTFKNGSYTIEITDALGRKISFKDSLPATIPPAIIQSRDTLYSDIKARSYQWLESDKIIPGEIKEFLKVKKSGVYSLKIVDTNSCELASQPLAVNLTGIENEEFLKGFSAEFLKESNEIFVQIPGEESTISIISLKGDVVFKKECVSGEREMRISALKFAQGLYYIRYESRKTSFGRLLPVIK